MKVWILAMEVLQKEGETVSTSRTSWLVCAMYAATKLVHFASSDYRSCVVQGAISGDEPDPVRGLSGYTSVRSLIDHDSPEASRG